MKYDIDAFLKNDKYWQEFFCLEISQIFNINIILLTVYSRLPTVM